MTIANEVKRMDATDLAGLVRAGEVKPEELVQATIDNIESLNPKLNAVVYKLYEQALASSKGVLPEGPFTGVPFLLKNILAWLGGAPNDQGSAFVKGFIAPHDATLVSRYKKAGLIICGITNAPEFGILPTTEPALYGPTRNPWDLNHITGGSSGGSAAAVAAGIVPFAHANDGGGSIRIPASCCGLVGLKPTRARNPLGPDIGDLFGGIVAEHAVTRSVRDSAALLDATAGPEVGDPYWAPPPWRPFLQEVGANPGKLKIALIRETPTGVPLHADCLEAIDAAGALCSGLGHEVEVASPVLEADKIVPMFMAVWAAGIASTIDGLAMLMGKAPTEEQFEPGTWALYQMGRERTASEYLLAIQWLQGLSRQIARFGEGYDVVLTPTLAMPPLPLGQLGSSKENPMAGMMTAAAFCPFTPLYNVTGQPAMSVPLHWNKNGLPIGTQLVGKFGDEAALFRLASQLEEAAPWKNKHPGVSV